MLILTVIRHAQSFSDTFSCGFPSDHHLSDIARFGYTPENNPLTEQGVHQASVFGKLLTQTLLESVQENHSPESVHILHSGFTSARQTSNILFHSLKKELNHQIDFYEEECHHLRGPDPGISFYMTRNAFCKQFPAYVLRVQERNYFRAPLSGDSIASREYDVGRFIAHVKKLEGKTDMVIACSHSGFMQAFEKMLSFPQQRVSEELSVPENLEAYSIVVDRGKFHHPLRKDSLFMKY